MLNQLGRIYMIIFVQFFELQDIPLVIDQPEDNLDNQSIAIVLVPFIQADKNRWPVILVIHNPNLAVVVDSDQIIDIKINKENAQLVKVEVGVIEDEIRNQSIVTILEGTMFSLINRIKIQRGIESVLTNTSPQS